MAFRTRCPSCGTLFSAPDEMIRMEIKCPRCKSLFLAEEEPMSGRDEEPRDEAAQPTLAPQYFCKTCGAGFVEEDILDGIAVRRFDEVYCRKHFVHNFPNECEKHPGTKAAARCARCRMPLCENCVIELQNEKLCGRCKNRVLGELRGDYAPGEFPDDMRPGLPWERPGGTFFERMFGTIKEVLLSPGAAFENMKVRGGYSKPLLYVWLLTVAGTMMAIFWMFVIFGAVSGEFSPFGRPDELFVTLIAYMFQSMLGGLIGPYIQAAIYHVCLMLVGGAKRDYECTYRVVAYAGGSVMILCLIPLVGMAIASVWSIVATIIGFSRAHGITGGRAALAFFLPFILCCGLYIVMFAAMFSMVRH